MREPCDDDASDVGTTDQLLASRQWTATTSTTYDGLEKRLLLMAEAGLPPMRVLPHTTLAQLGRIPRSTEGHTVNALDVLRQHGLNSPHNRQPNVVFIFFSHSWLRKSWCEVEGRNLPYRCPEWHAAKKAGSQIGFPDSSDHVKARALIQWALWLCWFHKKGYGQKSLSTRFLPHGWKEVYYWIDYCSADQTNLGPDMVALPAYAATSSALTIYETGDYSERAWCHVEQLMAYGFMSTGMLAFTLYPGLVFRPQMDFECLPAWCFLGPQLVPTITTRRKALPDPTEGKLTVEADRAVVANLSHLAKSSKTFSFENTWKRHCNDSPMMCFLTNVCFCGQF